MSIETKVEGNPDQITSLASWLTSSLEPAVSTSGDKLTSDRSGRDKPLKRLSAGWLMQ